MLPGVRLGRTWGSPCGVCRLGFEKRGALAESWSLTGSRGLTRTPPPHVHLSRALPWEGRSRPQQRWEQGRWAPMSGEAWPPLGRRSHWLGFSSTQGEAGGALGFC